MSTGLPHIILAVIAICYRQCHARWYLGDMMQWLHTVWAYNTFASGEAVTQSEFIETNIVTVLDYSAPFLFARHVFNHYVNVWWACKQLTNAYFLYTSTGNPSSRQVSMLLSETKLERSVTARPSHRSSPCYTNGCLLMPVSVYRRADDWMYSVVQTKWGQRTFLLLSLKCLNQIW